MRRLLCLMLSFGVADALVAQAVIEPWVEQAEQRIAEHRKTELRVIVLDGDQRVAAGAAVAIEQLRHDFALGVVVDGPRIGGYDAEAALMRCFNAVSLKRMTSWAQVQPESAEAFDFQAVKAAVTWAEVFDLGVHWGGVVSADPAHQPEWAVDLGADDRLRSAAALVDMIGFTFGGRVRSAALYTHGLDQAWLSEPALRWLFSHAKTARAGWDLRLGYEQALVGDRGRRMLVDADGKFRSFVRGDGVSVGQVFAGRFSRGALDRMVQRLGALGLPTIVDGLEVGGENEMNASQNLEAALITLFAEPAIEGIYFEGLTKETARDPVAALVDDAGEPTVCGRVIDDLFRRRWWTQVTAVADELGNVRARVFAGTYAVTATLADGRVLETRVRVPMSEEERVVVLEPVWGEEVKSEK